MEGNYSYEQSLKPVAPILGSNVIFNRLGPGRSGQRFLVPLFPHVFNASPQNFPRPEILTAVLICSDGGFPQPFLQQTLPCPPFAL